MRMILALLGLISLFTATSGAVHARTTACEIACRQQYARWRCHQPPSVCERGLHDCIFRCARMPRPNPQY
jgi:hypothetical protein